MKRIILRKFSESLEKIMDVRKITAKELAHLSKIGYSSLIPIINGNRDCGVTKLVAIANALNCTSDDLLNGVIISHGDSNYSINAAIKPQPKYLAVFISLISVTYCMIFEVSSKNKKITMFQFALGCGLNPDKFLDYLAIALQEVISKNFKETPNNNEIAVFASVQQYEWEENRIKIQQKGNGLFATFILESDAITNYRALFNKDNGILVTINDGNGITYSIDHGENIAKVQGYGFPISDVAGNYWIGCEAIKHVINVKEEVEPNSLVSDRILALFNDNIYYLSESLERESKNTYAKASSVVRELLCEDQKAQDIIKHSTNLLLERIVSIDNKLKTKLPIALAGDLANVYKQFFPKNRLISFKGKPNNLLLNYALSVLQQSINPSKITK